MSQFISSLTTLQEAVTGITPVLTTDEVVSIQTRAGVTTLNKTLISDLVTAIEADIPSTVAAGATPVLAADEVVSIQVRAGVTTLNKTLVSDILALVPAATAPALRYRVPVLRPVTNSAVTPTYPTSGTPNTGIVGAALTATGLGTTVPVYPSVGTQNTAASFVFEVNSDVDVTKAINLGLSYWSDTTQTAATAAYYVFAWNHIKAGSAVGTLSLTFVGTTVPVAINGVLNNTTVTGIIAANTLAVGDIVELAVIRCAQSTSDSCTGNVMLLGVDVLQ